MVNKHTMAALPVALQEALTHWDYHRRQMHHYLDQLDILLPTIDSGLLEQLLFEIADLYEAGMHMQPGNLFKVPEGFDFSVKLSKEPEDPA